MAWTNFTNLLRFVIFAYPIRQSERRTAFRHDDLLVAREERSRGPLDPAMTLVKSRISLSPQAQDDAMFGWQIWKFKSAVVEQGQGFLRGRQPGVDLGPLSYKAMAVNIAKMVGRDLGRHNRTKASASSPQ